MIFPQDSASASKLLEALRLLHKQLEGAEVPWLLGGSCALWLQEVDLSSLPRDIDVYTDHQHVGIVHELLSKQAMDEPVLDEDEIYSSWLSHYRLGEYTMELVGDFRIDSGSSAYLTEVTERLAPAARQASIGSSEVVLSLMPLSHELLFNILRSRPDRYQAIASAMGREPEQHSAILDSLIRNNQWSQAHLLLIKELVPWAWKG